MEKRFFWFNSPQNVQNAKQQSVYSGSSSPLWGLSREFMQPPFLKIFLTYINIPKPNMKAYSKHSSCEQEFQYLTKWRRRLFTSGSIVYRRDILCRPAFVLVYYVPKYIYILQLILIIVLTQHGNTIFFICPLHFNGSVCLILYPSLKQFAIHSAK